MTIFVQYHQQSQINSQMVNDQHLLLHILTCILLKAELFYLFSSHKEKIIYAFAIIVFIKSLKMNINLSSYQQMMTKTYYPIC